jgi:hypothetical protein
MTNDNQKATKRTKTQPETPPQRHEAVVVDPRFVQRTHEELWAVCKKLPSDFEPYGERSREIGGPDCSCGCTLYHVLIGAAGWDWGVCVNPRSPRQGLLTFEHQGCLHYQDTDPEKDDLWPQLDSDGA